MTGLHDETVHLLEDARAGYAAWARKDGLPFTTPAERVRVGPELRSFRPEAVVVSENASWRYLGNWRVGAEWRSAALALGHAAASAYASTLPFPERAYSSFAAQLLELPPAGFDYSADPSRWLVENAFVPAAVYYIRSLSTPEFGDQDAASAIAAQVLHRMSSGMQGTRVSIAVAGVETEGVIAVSGLSLRPLSETERGDLLRQTTGQHLGTLPPLAAAYLRGDLPTHVLNADEWHRNDVRNPEAESVAPRALLASFALHGYWLAGVGASAMSFLPEWSLSGTGSGPIPMAFWATDVQQVTPRDLEAISATLASIRDFDWNEPRSSRDLALHRFALGCSREDPVDGLIDLVIALEALLLPYDVNAMRGDLSFRFRLHGALWIEGDRTREATWKQLNDLYAARSAAVHGSKYPSRQTVTGSFRTARALAAQGLLRAVQEGFPDAARLRALALAAGP